MLTTVLANTTSVEYATATVLFTSVVVQTFLKEIVIVTEISLML